MAREAQSSSGKTQALVPVADMARGGPRTYARSTHAYMHVMFSLAFLKATTVNKDIVLVLRSDISSKAYRKLEGFSEF